MLARALVRGMAQAAPCVGAARYGAHKAWRSTRADRVSSVGRPAMSEHQGHHPAQRFLNIQPTTPAGNFRYPKNAEVYCYLGTLHWAKGVIVKHNYEEPKGRFHPYQVELAGARRIFVPCDDEFSIIRFRENEPLQPADLDLLQSIGRFADEKDRDAVTAHLADATRIARVCMHVCVCVRI